jgi:hypothetical protein
MADVIGWISVVVFLIAAGLVACFYRHVWHDILHMTEPFTYWFCQVAVSSPWAWWGGVGLFFVLSILTAYFGETWQRLLGIAWTCFFSWFIPHILTSITGNLVKLVCDRKVRAENLRWFPKLI